MGPAQRQRLAPEERRARLVAAAQRTFATNGYTQIGLAEVASEAGVSKTLLYHYFPDGRPELYRAVMKELVDQVTTVIRTAVSRPTSSERRLAGLVTSLLDYFGQNPEAYRLLILEPWGSGDAGVVGEAVAARAHLAGELYQLLGAAGESVTTTMVGGTAAMGALLHVCELASNRQITREEAIELTQRFLQAGLTSLNLMGP